jgi:hypothetical protein
VLGDLVGLMGPAAPANADGDAWLQSQAAHCSHGYWGEVIDGLVALTCDGDKILLTAECANIQLRMPGQTAGDTGVLAMDR